MKVIYMGTPDFAVPCLERLVKDKFDVCLVVTQPDKAQGRKMVITPSPVKQTALKYGLEVYQPNTLKSDEALEKLASYNADYFVVAAFGKILPQRILDLPKYGCVNVHGSILPEYRGSAPIQRAVIDGKETSGLTTMLMDAGIDTGDILLKYETPIGENETAGEFFDRLANKAPDLLIETLQKYSYGEITLIKQDDSKATYAGMLNKTEAIINPNDTALTNHNKIKGMNPWPVAYTVFDSKKLKIYSSLLTDKSKNLPNGTVIVEKNNMYIVCGDKKLLSITEVQLEGSKRMDISSFLAGHRDIDGKILSE